MSQIYSKSFYQFQPAAAVHSAALYPSKLDIKYVIGRGSILWLLKFRFLLGSRDNENLKPSTVNKFWMIRLVSTGAPKRLMQLEISNSKLTALIKCTCEDILISSRISRARVAAFARKKSFQFVYTTVPRGARCARSEGNPIIN